MGQLLWYNVNRKKEKNKKKKKKNAELINREKNRRLLRLRNEYEAIKRENVKYEYKKGNYDRLIFSFKFYIFGWNRFRLVITRIKNVGCIHKIP